MLTFKLSVAPADSDLNSAFAQLFKDKHSALVVEGAEGDYRLIKFDHLTEALAHGASKLDQVQGQRLDKLEGSARANYDPALTEVGATVGLIKVARATARLYSVTEFVGTPFVTPSAVARCDRPKRPADLPPKDWYHYYPPNTGAPPRPYRCVVKGCPGHVR